jgi:hypothetical protein
MLNFRALRIVTAVHYMFHTRLHLLSAGVLVLFTAGCCTTFAQDSPCPPPAVSLSTSDPAYSDAMQLAHQLEKHGFIVRCIFPTKFGSIFQVSNGDVVERTIEGEANFTTNFGAFDAVFVPKPQTFADFKVTEHREGGGYLYRFSGTPRVWAVNRYGTAYRQYFLKRGNQLLVVGDEQLRMRLERALHLEPTKP